jgi:hypothetical protein
LGQLGVGSNAVEQKRRQGNLRLGATPDNKLVEREFVRTRVPRSVPFVPHEQAPPRCSGKVCSSAKQFATYKGQGSARGKLRRSSRRCLTVPDAENFDLRSMSGFEANFLERPRK